MESQPSFIKNKSMNLQKGKVKYFSFQGVDVFYKQTHLLRKITLDIHRGDFKFVTGRTGAGKTTLLNLIADDCPSFTIKGKIKKEETITSSIFISRVFQDLKIFKKMSVLKNLEYCFDSNLYSRSSFEKEIRDYSRMLGISDKLHSQLENCSGGIIQKVSILRAILSKPDIILADEPTSSLDKASSMTVYEIFKLLNKNFGTTIIWATHDRDLVRSLSGEIIHIENGKLAHQGSTCFI